MHHSRIYWIIGFYLAFLLQVKASKDKLSAADVETVSYDLYLQKNWSELTLFCERAISQGYDYYYLRMRIGIACYERKQYRKSIDHFKKALEFNAHDETANEYLYFSCLFSGQYEEARWLTKSFDSTFAAKLSLNRIKAFDFAFSEIGVKLPNNKLYEPATYSGIGLSHYLSRRIALMHVVNYYGQSESRFNLQQYQYYLRATTPFKKGLKLMVGGMYAYNKNTFTYKTITKIIETKPFIDPNLPAPSVTPKSSYDTIYAVHQSQSILTTYVGAFTLIKRIPLADFSIGATVTSLDTSTQYQANAGATLFPFKNNSCSVGIQAYYHSNNGRRGFVAFSPSMNIAPTKKSSISLSYFTNQGNNTIEQTGYLLNNSIDLTTSRLMAQLSYQLFSNIHVYGLYGYELKQDNRRNFEYHYHTVVLGLKIVP